MKKWIIVAEGTTIYVDAATRDEALFRAGLAYMGDFIATGGTKNRVDASGNEPGASILRQIHVTSATFL